MFTHLHASALRQVDLAAMAAEGGLRREAPRNGRCPACQQANGGSGCYRAVCTCDCHRNPAYGAPRVRMVMRRTEFNHQHSASCGH